MILTEKEREFLAVWAREEWEPACYSLPAHRLQLAREVRGASLSLLIKIWADTEGRKDHEILEVAGDSELRWPWSTPEEFQTRLAEACRQRNWQQPTVPLDAIHANQH